MRYISETKNDDGIRFIAMRNKNRYTEALIDETAEDLLTLLKLFAVGGAK